MTVTNMARTANSQRGEPLVTESTTPGGPSSPSPRNPHSTQSQEDCSGPFSEDLPEDPVEGWPTVSKMMASTPEWGNLCRFSDLNMKSLLYYQAELFQLRQELHHHEYNDFRNAEPGSSTSEFFSRADFLVASKDAEMHKQWDVMVKIREVLKEYSRFFRSR